MNESIYNLYYLLPGIPGQRLKRNLTIVEVLSDVVTILDKGGEITSIIDADED